MSDEIDKNSEQNSSTRQLKGRLLALDLGRSRVGVAVSDELGLTARELPFIRRSNWKELLREISKITETFDAQAVVIGLPLRLDGTEGDAAVEARRIARNLERSLGLAVYMQDERLTSKAAERDLRAAGVAEEEISGRIDGAAARLILLDFLSQNFEKVFGERK